MKPDEEVIGMTEEQVDDYAKNNKLTVLKKIKGANYSNASFVDQHPGDLTVTLENGEVTEAELYDN